MQCVFENVLPLIYAQCKFYSNNNNNNNNNNCSGFKEGKGVIIDIAVPGDCRIGIKETEKVEKYDELKREIRKIWAMKKVEVIPIVVGALGAVSNKLDKWIEKLGIHIRTELLQKTALLGTARTLRRNLES